MAEKRSNDLVETVKHRARLLHRRAVAGEADALARLRRLPELRAHDDTSLATGALRRHALSALALELGFESWPHAKAVLSGAEVNDLGTLMHRDAGGAFANIWSASHDEARRIREEHGGWLLGYRRQFLIVEASFLEHLGLDAEDPDWERIGRDWTRPSDRAAWGRLTARAMDARLSV